MTTPWIAAFIVLAAFAALLGLLVLGLLRQAVPLIEQAQIALKAVQTRLATNGLPVGMEVPAFRGQTLSGALFTERDLRGVRSVVLFVSSGCHGCAHLISDLAVGHVPELDARLIVVADESEIAQIASAELAGVTILAQRNRSIADVFESNRTPHAFAIDGHAIVRAAGSPNDWRAVRALLAAGAKGGESPNRHKTLAVSAVHD